MQKNYMFPLRNQLVFALVMQDEKCCADLIERILDRKVRQVNIVNRIEIDYEKSIILTPQTKYVRLDVLLEGDDTWYDLEMQCENEGNIPKRTRYIHGIMDAQELEPGDDYNKLKKNFVIFICCFDPLGEGEPLYFFEMFDMKNDLSLGDDSYTILLNSKARKGEVSERLKNLFDYINTNKVAENDSLICELDEAVQKWNKGDKMDMLLTATQKDQAIKEERARQEGIAEGRAEGMAAGERKRALEDAKAFLEEGINVEIIARCTGLNVEEIESL